MSELAPVSGERVRPLRRSVTHLYCGQATYLDATVAEIFAREPARYGTAFCRHCACHRPVIEFVWTGDRKQVGS